MFPDLYEQLKITQREGDPLIDLDSTTKMLERKFETSVLDVQALAIPGNSNLTAIQANVGGRVKQFIYDESNQSKHFDIKCLKEVDFGGWPPRMKECDTCNKEVPAYNLDRWGDCGACRAKGKETEMGVGDLNTKH